MVWTPPLPCVKILQIFPIMVKSKLYSPTYIQSVSGRGRNFLSKMWLGSGGVTAGQTSQKPDQSGQHEILFNDLYQEVRCAAPSAQVHHIYASQQ